MKKERRRINRKTGNTGTDSMFNIQIQYSIILRGLAQLQFLQQL